MKWPCPHTTYGFIHSKHPEGGKGIDTYMACVEVSGAAGLPEGAVSAVIPGGKYAVFTVKGGLGDIPRAYGYINEEWMPASGYQEARCGAVEAYDERFVPDGTCEFEIWVAVK